MTRASTGRPDPAEHRAACAIALQELRMSALSRREEMAVSGAALSGAPWSAATVTGGVVAAGDLGLQLIGGHIGLTMLSGPLSLGVVAFFAVAAAGALIRARH